MARAGPPSAGQACRSSAAGAHKAPCQKCVPKSFKSMGENKAKVFQKCAEIAQKLSKRHIKGPLSEANCYQIIATRPSVGPRRGCAIWSILVRGATLLPMLSPPKVAREASHFGCILQREFSSRTLKASSLGSADPALGSAAFVTVTAAAPKAGSAPPRSD